MSKSFPFAFFPLIFITTLSFGAEKNNLTKEAVERIWEYKSVPEKARIPRLGSFQIPALVNMFTIEEKKIWEECRNNLPEIDWGFEYCLLTEIADKKFLEKTGGRLKNFPPQDPMYRNLALDPAHAYLKEQCDLKKNPNILPEIRALGKKYGFLPPDPAPLVPVSPPAPDPATNSFLAKLSSLKKVAKENLGYILAGTAILSYSAILFKLFKEAQYTKNEDAWFAFEESYMTPESFIMAPLQETRATLLRAIEKRYKTDSAQALQAFMSDTKQEMKRLKNFLAWHEWLDYLMLDAILPDQKEAQHKAKTNLIKLEYMRSLFEE